MIVPSYRLKKNHVSKRQCAGTRTITPRVDLVIFLILALRREEVFQRFLARILVILCSRVLQRLRLLFLRLMAVLTLLLNCNLLPRVIALALLESLVTKTWKKIPMVLVTTLTKTTHEVIALVNIGIVVRKLIFGLPLDRVIVTLPLDSKLILTMIIRWSLVSLRRMNFCIKRQVAWSTVTIILILVLALRRYMIVAMLSLMFIAARTRTLVVRRMLSLLVVIRFLIVQRQIIVNISYRVSVGRLCGWYRLRMRLAMLSRCNTFLLECSLIRVVIIRGNTVISFCTRLRQSIDRRLTLIVVSGRSGRLIIQAPQFGLVVVLRVLSLVRQRAHRLITAQAHVPRHSYVRMLVRTQVKIWQIIRRRPILTRQKCPEQCFVHSFTFPSRRTTPESSQLFSIYKAT